MPEPIQIPEIQTSQEAPDQSSNESGSDFSLANPFLEGVAESDREIVSKYINEWDGQVTQKFQELNGQLKPYQELGVDLDSIKHAVSVMQWADSDPVGFYNEVKNTLKSLQEQGVIDMGILDDEVDDSGPVGSNLPEYDGIPKEFLEKHQNLEKQVSEFNEWRQKQEQQAESQTRQQQLDNLFSDLENEHGKFDRAAVMGRLLEGMDPADAVKDWQKMMKEFSSPERKTPPQVLPGGGQKISDQVDASKIRNDKKARTSLVTDILKTIDS